MGSQFPRGWGVASQGFFPGCSSRIGRLLINNTFSVELNISYLAVKAACKRTQQLPTLLRQQYWELLYACWQWSANECNNSQQCWDLQCILGKIQPIRLWRPCVMSTHGPNNVGRAVQTDPTLLCYASAITEQKKCWELLPVWPLSNFAQQHATTSNNMRQRVQTDATCNIQPCWEFLANNVASVCT